MNQRATVKDTLGGKFLYAVLGGICIGIGSTIYLRVKGTFDGSNVVAALLFTTGLFIICTRGYNLFTGKVCYLFERDFSYLQDLGVIWLGNFVGTFLFAMILWPTNIRSDVKSTALSLATGKMDSGYLSLFLLAIICGIFIFVAVDGYKSNPHTAGKYLAMVLGISGFVLLGAEHSIAGMYYWSVSGMLFQAPLSSLLRILVITLGNSIGGIILPVAERIARMEIYD